MTRLCAGTTTIAWENLVEGGTPAQAALVSEDGSTPLTAGTSAIGDGATIALGYFSGATSSAVFDGEWVPLTGPQAANIPFQRTTVGDSAGGGITAGFFSLQTDFDSEDSAIFQRIPDSGTRLAVAIYDGSSITASSHFNIATHDSWRWEDPDPLGLPTFIFINLALGDPTWFGGAGTALRTAVPVASFPGGAARAPARLINISTRGFVGDGDAVMIPGFVLSGTGSREILVRAVGPTLADEPYGVAGTLADPVLTLIRQAEPNVIFASNDDWGDQPDPGVVAAAMAATGAFPIPPESLDAALVATLPVSPGGYSVQVRGKAGATGVAIAEVYLTDTDASKPTALVNISTRGFVGTGDSVMIAGFTLDAGGPRRLLIRAVGPTLAAEPFGLEGTLVNPIVSVIPTVDPRIPIAHNENWGADGQAAAIVAAQVQVGAFPLMAGSQDAALLLDLPASTAPRGYTVQVSGAEGASGLVIAEVYELP